MSEKIEFKEEIQGHDRKIILLESKVFQMEDALKELKVITTQTRDSILKIEETIKTIPELVKESKGIDRDLRDFQKDFEKERGKFTILIPILMLIISLLVTFSVRTALPEKMPPNKVQKQR